MTATRKGAGATSPGASLPAITVGRFGEAAALLEQLVEEKEDLFVSVAHRFREEHRRVTDRRLTHTEAAELAAGMLGDGDQVALAVRYQQSDLRAYDEPSPNEILIAAGVSTAAAFYDAAKRVVALIEMPADEFKAAREAQRLDEAIDRYVLDVLDELPMDEARPRAQAAFRHYLKAAGQDDSGKATGLLIAVVKQAYLQAMLTVGSAMRGTGSSSLTGSPPSTDGPEPTSSTASATATP